MTMAPSACTMKCDYYTIVHRGTGKVLGDRLTEQQLIDRIRKLRTADERLDWLVAGWTCDHLMGETREREIFEVTAQEFWWFHVCVHPLGVCI